MSPSVRVSFLALVLPILGSAQSLVPATGEFRVNQNVASDQYQPQVAIGPSNDYIVVWKSWMQDDNTASIYFRRYNSTHITLSGELLVATGASYQENNVVKVIYWTDGKYIIAWNDGSNLNMRVLNADNTMGTTIPLGGSGEWDIAVQGNKLVIFYGSGNAELYLRAYDMGTNNFLGAAVLATEDPGNDYGLPNIRFKNDGSLVAVFGRGNYPNRVYRKTFDGDLLAQINETIVHDQQSSLNCIDVSTNASDEILISTKWGVNGTDVFMVWLLDANGAVIIDQLGTFSSGYAYYTSECALFDNGDFVTVMGTWTNLSDPDNYQVRGFYASNYNFQNTGVTVLNTTTAGEQVYPAVEKRNDGGFVVVWQGNGFQGDTQGINARVWSGATFPGVQATDNLALEVDETGTTATLQLRLGTQPASDVVVDMTVNDATEASINVPQLTFTYGNWDQPQAVVITGLDDVLDDGDISLNVVATINASTVDPIYAPMGPKYFAVTNLDNDAVFTMPQEQTFCRTDGMGGVNVLVTNVGSPVGSPSAVSSDQSVVDDVDIDVTQVNANTFAVAISGLENNVPGTATITVTVDDGLFSYYDSFPVTTLGATPVITQNGAELSTTAGVSYQWFVDEAFIPSGTQQTYTPAANGDYSVLVVDADGCYNYSVDFTFNSTGIATLSRNTLWVGPLTDVLPLCVPADGMLRLLDTTGKVVYGARVAAGMRTIALPTIAPGAYVVLVNGQAVRVVKE